jgi:5-methylcytosine-specific restriction endonuclease McrA
MASRHLEKLVEKQRGQCHYCGVRMNRRQNHPQRATVDHVKPRAHGGTREGNTVAACRRCNELKGPLDAETFLALRGEPGRLLEALRVAHARLQMTNTESRVVVVRETGAVFEVG